ncbi:hypothetical protein TCDM_11921 [Trypanosoma cruzi Dm28c]|uniref:Uncharacterized protein n=1 Tax=Trypanosoma cruzi Dm28c TaxID=1416333 RepID=V5B898_TRYCR|nr:hypothetical protein TCDM_11921 [Trypanosoma cruzi Dm28c]
MRPSTAAAAHRAHHTRRKSDSPCALPLFLPLHGQGGSSSSHPQPPAHAAKEASKSTAMCIVCVCGCVCLQTHEAKK